jgi:hypothetical protein
MRLVGDCFNVQRIAHRYYVVSSKINRHRQVSLSFWPGSVNAATSRVESPAALCPHICTDFHTQAATKRS